MAIERMNPLSARKILMTLVSLAAIAAAVPTTATPVEYIERTIASDRLPLLAQGSRTQNLCRTVTARWGLIVRESPNPNSPPKGRLDYESDVTLAFNFEAIPGPDGEWVEIAFPVKGYILNGNLELCSEGVNAAPNHSTSAENTTPENPVAEIPVSPPNPTTEIPVPPPNTATSNPVPENPVPAENSVSDPKNIPDGPFCRKVNGLVTPQGLAVRAEPAGASQYIGGIDRNGRVQLVENYEYISDKNGANISWVQIVAPIQGFVSVNSLIRCL